ncbi:hypothetical protein BDW02DRAFT_144815 [Decorospora gaudefroyi]|uniref:5'-3' DNA helicase ZGRF1-like N-terminal domain-containing protein n=1 Tax=Decorospora gaudefroyi TaxID=184978 RepID=A0A6A5K5B7_9PLEO|nr:hypothetical protein BDW02DRAFT_144815 [Decorospora gaudefroyi]
MTAPVRNTQHASAIAAITASQTTAPVAEFRCLFTQDIKRKQKRWQDGYLKFHTFNNRVMIYDQARNFLGDTYYKDSDELHEGDELTLNNGALVEVAEAVGITHTDLTPLLEKKTKEAPPRPTAASQPKPFQRPSSVAPGNAQRNGSQLRHKSLNTLLGTPKGPIGKAQRMRSPYEARREKENENAVGEERPPKRQKTARTPVNWRTSSPVREEIPADARNVPKTPTFIPPTANVITIDSESDPHSAFLSDVTLPNTPPNLARARAERRVRPAPVTKPSVSEKPPKIPRGKVPLPSIKALQTPKQPAPPSSPPVSASNRLTNVEFAVQPVKSPPNKPSAPLLGSPQPNRKAKSLRLSTGVKRGKLLCQSLAQPISRTVSEHESADTTSRVRNPSSTTSKEMSPGASLDHVLPQMSVSASAKITSRSKDKRKGAEVNNDVTSKRARVSKSPSIPSPGLFDDPESMHGFMDQQLMVPSPPAPPQGAPTRPIQQVSNSKSIASKETMHKPAKTKHKPLKVARVAALVSKSPSPKEMTQKSAPPKTPAEYSAPTLEATLPSPPILEPPNPASRDVSPSQTETDAPSRACSTSPHKMALPTGGFPKRPRTRMKQSATKLPTPDVPAPAPRKESDPLRPHPLRANKTRPLMSTTELAALLQKPKTLKKILADPIQDEASGAGKSPNRSFRRVRSENDAPIPSTAEDWEKRSLPKPSSNLMDGADEPPMTVTENEPEPAKKKSALSALIKSTDPRRKFKRTQSLQVETNVPTAAVGELELPSPVVDEDVGPWSTEAGDLFDWKPPRREK